LAKLGDIMTREVFATSPDTPVAEVAKSMVKGRFGSALVTQSSMLVGIFTERDALRAAASGSDLTRSRIADWMTRDPQTTEPDADSDDAAQVMLSQGFRHLPVMVGNAVVGIVSFRDVMSARVRRAAT
jgi:CBS domain-containing protein